MSKNLLWPAVFIAGGAVLLTATAASACMPPPPMTEEARAEIVRQGQARRWIESENVFVARATEREKIPAQMGLYRAALIPVLQLKGERVIQPVVIQHEYYSTCGPQPGFIPLSNIPEDFYVVFSSKSPPETGSVTAVMARSFIVESSVIEAWAAAYERAATGEAPDRP